MSQQSTQWMTKGEWGTNAQRLSQFYDQVLKAFIIQVERECRYKGLISDEQLQEMEKRVRAKLKHPQRFIEKCLLMREGSFKAEAEIKNEPAGGRELPELKEEHNDDKDEYLYVDFSKKKQQKRHEQHKEEVIDDLELFQDLGNQEMNLIVKSIKSEAEVKKEDNSQEYIENRPAVSQKEIKNEEPSDYDDDQNLSVEECLDNLGSIMIATFAAQTLRHKPKEEKITVSLDNSFLKSPYNELYIGNVPIEIIKVEKSDIKKQFVSHHKNKKNK